jgi:transcriptional regulator GlxA family with amidase domain
MDPRIQRTLAEIHARPAAPMTIAALARAAGLSGSRFAHLFQQEVGTSPARYVHALRMIRARLLLERTFLSVREVMVQVGCSDPSHFARDFRDFHGLLPSEWRTTAVRPSGDSDALEHATVERIVVLANERRKRHPTTLPGTDASDSSMHRAS